MKHLSIYPSTIFLLTIVLTACRISPPPPISTTPDKPLQNPTSQSTSSTTKGVIKIKGEVWADNWSAFYLGDQLVMEDSVPITTERSFNAEVFTFEAAYPMSFNFILKDFKENDTGLEYIGTNRQQMGDGGLIAQFTNTDTGELLAVSTSNWACMVIHEAPLDKSCEKEANPVAGQGPCSFTSLEEPTGWKNANFDASSWSNATLYTADQVGPKDGYDEIKWDPSAKFIWGPDLETDNTVLCRLTVTGKNP